MAAAMRDSRLLALAAIAILTWACDARSRSLPTSPSVENTASVSRQSYTLAGLVYEMTPDGPVPVEGVRIEGDNCEKGGCQGQNATTGVDGLYRLSLYAGLNGIYVTRAGYAFDGPILPNCDDCIALITLNDDTRFDLRLVRR